MLCAMLNERCPGAVARMIQDVMIQGLLALLWIMWIAAGGNGDGNSFRPGRKIILCPEL